MSEHIAVLIDFENLVLGAKDALPQHPNPVPYAAIELVCRDYGNAAVRRAYADWGKFGAHQVDLALNGVDLIHMARFGYAQKNAADIRMAVDAMELLFTHPDLKVFVLVTGDGDFSPLVQRLREFGKRVVGVGTESNASKRLVSVCSEYKYWATLVARTDPKAKAVAEVEFDIGDGQELLLATIRRLTQPVLAATLKNKMLSIDPSFDEHNYGCDNFSDFLRRMDGVLDITKHDTQTRVAVRGGGTAEPRPDSPALVRQAAPVSLRDKLLVSGTDLPLLPQSRDALLTSVHDAWRTNRLGKVADINDVLFDENTGYVPNKSTRIGLSQALCHRDTQVLPLITDPNPDIRLHECSIAPYDGSACGPWTFSAHVAWLAWMMHRLKGQPDLDRAMVECFFADAEDYGRELVGEARRMLDKARGYRGGVGTGADGTAAMADGDGAAVDGDGSVVAAGAETE